MGLTWRHGDDTAEHGPQKTGILESQSPALAAKSRSDTDQVPWRRVCGASHPHACVLAGVWGAQQCAGTLPPSHTRATTSERVRARRCSRPAGYKSKRSTTPPYGQPRRWIDPASYGLGTLPPGEDEAVPDGPWMCLPGTTEQPSPATPSSYWITQYETVKREDERLPRTDWGQALALRSD